MDWTGFVLLGLAVGALQFVLDRGSRADWFESGEIIVATMLFVVSLGVFVRHIVSDAAHPIFNPRIFMDRNFTMATLATGAVSFGVFGSMILLPIFLQSLLNYPASDAGLLMVPRSLAVGAGMLLVGRLMTYLDTRVLIVAGAILCIASTAAMSRYTLEVDTWTLVWPGILQSVGIALMMVPLSVLAYRTLPRERIAEATGMNNLMRNLGSAAGISIAATLFSRYTQQGWQQLGEYTNPLSPTVQQYLARLHLTPDQPLAATILAREVAIQAQIAAFSKVYLWIGAVLVVMTPVAFLLRTSLKKAPPPPVAE